MESIAKIGNTLTLHTEGNETKNAALELAAAGVPVFACKPDKTPATKNGFKDATTDAEKIRAMFSTPGRLIGMPTGQVSGISVIDEDPRNGGNLDDLGTVPMDVVARTRSGGRHVFVKHREGNRSGVVREGIDLKADGGYVVLWAHSEEGEWLSGDLSADLQPIPGHIRKGGHKFRNESMDTAEIRKGIEEGSRNQSIWSAACSYRERNLKLDDALDLAREAARNSSPPYPEDEAEDMVYRAYETYPPGDYPEPTDLTKGLAAQNFAHTDMGNADRFEHLRGEDYRYVPSWNKFIVWTGQRWEIDERNVMGKWAEETVKSMYGEAAQLDDSADRKALASFAKTCESLSRRDATIRTLKNRRTAMPGDFDADPWLMNCQNGTVDLCTGELREHRREDLITKMSPVPYDPHAKAPLWNKHVNRILPGYQLRKFIQKALGYSLTGDTSEQVLFIPHGGGANGKNVTFDTVMDVMGDYARTAAQDLLMDKGDSHPTEVADLHGARLVVSSEVKEGRRFDEPRIKRLTGDKYIKARRMREDNWQFRATHKIFMPVNHKPNIGGTDHGIWRRIKLIPFDVTIPEGERDPQLPQKLQAELPGILAWLVRGCLRWQRKGLGEPPEVTKATAAYREEMDVMAAFFSDKCDLDRLHTVGKGQLYEAYKDWCYHSGERAVTKKEFGTKMKERGFEDGKASGERVWKGIRTTPEPTLTVSSPETAPVDTLDTLDTSFGIAKENLEPSVDKPENVSNVSNTSSQMDSGGDVETPTASTPTAFVEDPEDTVIRCGQLAQKYPDEAKRGGMLDTDDPEYWIYRLEDAWMGTHSEEAVADALVYLRHIGLLG